MFDLTALGQGQGQVAKALRLLGPELEHAAQDDYREVELAGLLETPGHDAQQRRLLILQFDQVGEDAHSELAVALVRKESAQSRKNDGLEEYVLRWLQYAL